MKDPNSTRDIGPRVGTPLWLYMLGATAAGAVLLLVSGLGLRTDELRALAVEPLTWVLLCMIVLGELRPLTLPGQAPGDGVPTSLPFSLALVILHGLPVAALAQVTATAVSGFARGHAPTASPSTPPSTRSRSASPTPSCASCCPERSRARGCPPRANS